MFLHLGKACLTSSLFLLASLPINLVSKTAQEIYETGCAACHDSGVAGSPMTVSYTHLTLPTSVIV